MLEIEHVSTRRRKFLVQPHAVRSSSREIGGSICTPSLDD
jgi:hypothetical protein